MGLPVIRVEVLLILNMSQMVVNRMIVVLLYLYQIPMQLIAFKQHVIVTADVELVIVD